MSNQELNRIINVLRHREDGKYASDEALLETIKFLVTLNEFACMMDMALLEYWAVMKWQQFSSIARARNLKHAVLHEVES